MNDVLFSNVRDPENRSRKSCVCGGHNAGNAKANKLHNATKRRLEIRIARRRPTPWDYALHERTPESCNRCDGLGEIYLEIEGRWIDVFECPNCNGTGVKGR